MNMKCKINQIILNDEINQKLFGICAEGVELYIVGGYIRDIFLKSEPIEHVPVDIDTQSS